MTVLNCSTLILDLDGTISDPSLGICRCFNYALTQYGLAPIPEEVITREIGPPLDETFMKLAPGLDATAVPELVSIYRERYSDRGYSENTLYPDIFKALEELSNNGIRLGVCTSKREDFAIKILSMFGLLDSFKFVSGGDIGITKQSQLMSLLSADVIDNHAVMVGDRAIDIVSAQKNSLRSIGVLWGFGSHEELLAVKPDRILRDILELPKTIIL